MIQPGRLRYKTTIYLINLSQSIDYGDFVQSSGVSFKDLQI